LKLGNACCYSVHNFLSSSFQTRNTKIKIYKIFILRASYGYETWSPTLREERRLRIFENRALKRIFEPNRDEVTGEWRKLHNEELNGFLILTKYYSVDKIQKNEMGGICSAHGGEETCVQGLGGET